MQTGFPDQAWNQVIDRPSPKPIFSANRSLQDVMHRAILHHMIPDKNRIATWLRIILQCSLLFILTGCSADDPTRPNTFVPLTGIEIRATYEAMAEQTVNQYTAIGDFSGAFTRDITADVLWRIENKRIAAVSNNKGSEGLVTALLQGETSVTAIYGDFSESAPVVVTNAFLTGIEVLPQDLELQIGLTQQYEAFGTFSDNSGQEITSLVAWQSSDTDIATVDDTGLVATVAAGVSTISASWQGIAGNASLLVKAAQLTTVTIRPEDVTIARGTIGQFEAEGTFSDGATLDITDIVDWQSSDTGIGVINADGLATGVAPGEAEITASYEVEGETLSATAALTVTSAVIELISITPENSTVQEGESQQFTATGTFSDDSQQDITDLVTWSTSDNLVGTISNSPNSRGLFVSIAAGDTLIEATFDGVVGGTILTVE